MWLKHIIHDHHENGGAISKVKRHDQPLIVLEICNFEQSFSTRKYKKTHLHHYKSPKKKLETQEEKLASQGNNKVIEDPKIRSRLQIGAQISINKRLAHFIWIVRQLLLQCAQGSCNYSFW